MTDCSKCKHFVYCDWGKILFHKAFKEPCEEHEERKVDDGRCEVDKDNN